MEKCMCCASVPCAACHVGSETSLIVFRLVQCHDCIGGALYLHKIVKMQNYAKHLRLHDIALLLRDRLWNRINIITLIFHNVGHSQKILGEAMWSSLRDFSHNCKIM